MTDIVKLLREEAETVEEAFAGNPAVVCEDWLTPLAARLTAAADELEASAEWALCKWLAEDAKREAKVERRDNRAWFARIGPRPNSVRFAVSDDMSVRGEAIRAAIKAWEER